jgi:inhibitor of cysteine peptidase
MRRVRDNKSVKYVKITVILSLACAVILSGCVNEGQNNTEPENTTNNSQGSYGEEYVYGTANVESIQIITLESFPVQIQVIAEGYLPDGCTEINGTKAEREGNVFDISISTKRPKDAVCTQAIENFTKIIPLEVQGLKAGNYTVNVNGVTGSFELAVDNIREEPPISMPPRQQVITEADNGTNISLENGSTFYLKLPENPSTGYRWELNLSQGLNNVSGEYYPAEQPEGVEHPLVGAGGARLWEIKAVAEGSQQVKGIYKRPWENETGTEDKFTLNVEVV